MHVLNLKFEPQRPGWFHHNKHNQLSYALLKNKSIKRESRLIKLWIGLDGSL
jgi:hypothetical protein